jgi:hypothetical protein
MEEISAVEIIDAPATVPLASAMLCLDCEQIFEQGGGSVCPVCASASVLNLAKAMEARNGDEK